MEIVNYFHLYVLSRCTTDIEYYPGNQAILLTTLKIWQGDDIFVRDSHQTTAGK